MEKRVYQKWQIKKLLIWLILFIVVGGSYLSYATWDMYTDKVAEESYWDNAMQQSDVDMEAVNNYSKDAVEVTVGTYVDTLKEINIKTSSFRVSAKIWFKWNGDEDLDMINKFHIYDGTINKLTVIKDMFNDGVHYQVCTADITVYKNFWTKRFPLDSHQLRFFIETDYDVSKVLLVGDEQSGYNESLSYAGYDFKRISNMVHYHEYTTSFGEPGYKNLITSEYMTQFEITRSGLGVYLKCFIALLGTSLWIFITIFICTFHSVDPLGLIPAALFGTVTNIMVGANLLPDALDIGLLEYVNCWGIMTILAGAILIINVNRIRTKHNDHKFAALFGQMMFITMAVIVILGHILLPVAAYLL